ncbi:MAG: sodium:proton antiporter [Phycisphaeraceae bacterium]|nr:sodium:proton antiporter [Phycisphaeraceae bacterium]
MKTPGHFYFATGTLSSVLDNAPTYLTFLQTRLGEIPQAQVDEAADVLQKAYESYEADPTRPFAAFVPKIGDPQVLKAVETVIHYHQDHIIAGKGHIEDAELKLGFLTGVQELNAFLIAISIGAVFFGAMTYIGNAPNFMVKSIAEASGIKMPTFLGYVFRYSIPMLLPVLIVVWAIFLL